MSRIESKEPYLKVASPLRAGGAPSVAVAEHRGSGFTACQ